MDHKKKKGLFTGRNVILMLLILCVVISGILVIREQMEKKRQREEEERLRQLAYSDLDAALLLGVETTIQEMKDRRLPVHQSTLRAQAWLREHGVTTEG